MKRLVLLLSLLLAAPVLAQAPAAAPAAPVAPAAAPAPIEPGGFQARVTPEQVRIGEPFIYELVITHPKDQRYELTPPADLGDFELLTQTRQRQDTGDTAVTTFGVKLSAFSMGTVKLPDLTFDVSTPEGARRFSAKGRSVEVVSTLPPDAQGKGEDLFDYQPPTEVPVRSWTLLYVLAGLVAAGLLAWALVRWLRRPRAAREVARPVLPLDARTRQALDALKRDGLHERGQVKEFYVRLSEIVRGYLGERYNFDALECTSGELMSSLRKRSTPGLPEEGLMRFVSESDLVKYAKADASPEACQDALAFGYELLEKTWAPPQPPPADAAQSRVS
ncbi:BatD family protein [Myxococcaceae bacterium GXIMD 01537]